jgi:hypothetical protein
MRYRDQNGQDWADIVAFVTMGQTRGGRWCEYSRRSTPQAEWQTVLLLLRQHPHLLERRSDMPRRFDARWQREHVANAQLQRAAITEFDAHRPLEDQDDLSL